jgi:hypothetical protein
MINLSKKEQYIYGPAVLLNSANWNPAFHPRDSIGEFRYNGGRHRGSASMPFRPKSRAKGLSPAQAGNKASKFSIFHGTPPNAQTFTTPDGQTFLAPAGTDFRAIYNAGKTNGIMGMNSAIGHYGTFDFQRNAGAGQLSTNTFYPAYANASNYAVGVYMNGADFSLDQTHNYAWIFAHTFSSNAGSPAQTQWQTNGWKAAEAYHLNGKQNN